MKKTILVVDDSKVIQNMINSMLKESFQLVFADDGKDALNKLAELNSQKTYISLIMTDINMPVMDGIEFITEVKKIPEFKFTPIIILTSEEQNPFKYKVVFNAWINKPFTQEGILDVTQKVLNPIEYMKAKYNAK